MATSTKIHQPPKLQQHDLFSQVMSSNGTVLMLMDNVVFRKVLPEQIQMAIAAQSTPEDAARTPESLGDMGGNGTKNLDLVVGSDTAWVCLEKGDTSNHPQPVSKVHTAYLGGAWGAELLESVELASFQRRQSQTKWLGSDGSQAASLATKDQKIYEIEWQELAEAAVEEESTEEKWLVLHQEASKSPPFADLGGMGLVLDPELKGVVTVGTSLY